MTKPTITSQNPIIMLDDSPADCMIATKCYAKSGLKNPFLTFNRFESFKEYLEDVRIGDRERPELILIDLNMPGTSGFEVIAWARKDPDFKDLHFLVSTSSASENDIARARELGATGYWTKATTVTGYVEFFNSLKSDDANPPGHRWN